MQLVKDCLQFTGKDDPLRGDAPYREVRTTAKDTLEAIFDSSQDIQRGGGSSTLAGRIQGIGGGPVNPSEIGGDASTSGENSRLSVLSNGLKSASSLANSALSLATAGSKSSDTSTSGGASFSGGRSMDFSRNGFGTKYGGIGNPNFQDPRNKPKGFIDRVRDRLDKFNESNGTVDKGSLSTATTSSFNSGGMYTGPGQLYSNQPADQPPVQSFSWQQSGTPSTASRGAPGGVWGQPVGMRNGSSSPRKATKFDHGNRGNSGGAASDGQYEQSLVNELCNASGLRSVPTKEKLEEFVRACATLDAEVVMPLLFDKLDEEEDWKVKHKVLCVFEQLVQREECEAYTDYIDDHAETLETLLNASHPSLRNRARRVWKLLYDEDPAGSEEPMQNNSQNTKNNSRNQAQQPVEDLLDFGAGEDQGGVENIASTAQGIAQDISGNVAQEAGGGGRGAPTSAGMFANMQMKAAGQPAASSTSAAGAAGEAEDLMTTKLDALVFENTSAGQQEKSSGFNFIATGASASASQNTSSGQSGIDVVNLMDANLTPSAPAGPSPSQLQADAREAALAALQAQIKNKQQQPQPQPFQQMPRFAGQPPAFHPGLPPQYMQQQFGSAQGMMQHPPVAFMQQTAPMGFAGQPMGSLAQPPVRRLSDSLNSRHAPIKTKEKPDKFDDIVKASMAEM